MTKILEVAISPTNSIKEARKIRQTILIAPQLLISFCETVRHPSSTTVFAECALSPITTKLVSAALAAADHTNPNFLFKSILDMADLDLSQQLILLLATSAISGLGVPIVLKRIDESRTQELKSREAFISRQAKIIDAQSTFLDELSQVLWEWRYAVMKITYYGSTRKQELYEKSCEEYQSEIWLHLNKIRYLTSKSRRLASNNCYQELLNFYFRIVDLDKRIFKAINIVEPKWERELELSDLNVEIFDSISDEIDKLLFLISHNLNLQPDFRRSS